MELKATLTLGKDHLNRLFPYYIEIDASFSIISFGNSLKKIVKESHFINFKTDIIIERPYFSDISWLELTSNLNQLYIIKCNSILFRGQFEYFEESNTAFFFGSPWVQNIDDLKQNNLYLTDFAIHDPTFDLLHIIKNIEINSDEIKVLLNKLKEKSDIIKESEAKYRTTLIMASDIIYKTDENGYFIYLNPAAEKITGFKTEELIHKHFTEIIRNDFKKIATINHLKIVSDNLQSSYFEFPIITKLGEEKWIGQSVQIISENRKNYFIGLAIDITKQKINEFKLIESNTNLKLLRKLIDNTSDAIQVSKEDGELVYINKEASNRLGIDNKLKSRYYVKDFEKIFSEDGVWERHVADVKLNNILIIEGENINLQSNKSFPVEVTVKYLNIDGVGYIIATSRDISERKHVEETIRKQKEKYQNIIANMNLGLLEVDLEEKIQYANPSFLLISGYEEKDLIGKIAGEMFAHNSNINLAKEKVEQRAQGISDSYEIAVKNKEGELRWWLISGAPNYDDIGNLIGSIGIHLDITEKKKLELELEFAKTKAEESSKAKEAFLANMSHEIRTPLNGIIGMIRMLSKEKLSPKQATYVNNTSIASQHLLSMLNNILDISKIEAGELILDLHHFNIQTLLSEVKSILHSKADEKELYLMIVHPENTNKIFKGDSSRFRQILINIIGNSIKFTESGGISVNYEVLEVNKNQHLLSISVADTGIGIDELYLKNLFNKFSQEDSSISRKYDGSGLGMSITYELIQLMNGTIDVISKKGEGTLVNMKFILSKGEEEKILQNNLTFLRTNQGELNILLVEDNEYNRIVAADTLKQINCKITEAINGLEAINKIKSGEKFDVILMDLQMPIMDGFESTLIIRKELNITTPIIALTANAFKSELEQCIEIGMNDCVTKPFEDEELINAIYKQLGKNEAGKLTLEKRVETDSQKLYNLDKLISHNREDIEYKKKMISIFSENALLSMSEIKKAYAHKNLTTVYKVAHRIKPSIDGMGIETLRGTIRFIEKNAKELNDGLELKRQIDFLFETLTKVINQLKEEK